MAQSTLPALSQDEKKYFDTALETTGFVPRFIDQLLTEYKKKNAQDSYVFQAFLPSCLGDKLIAILPTHLEKCFICHSGLVPCGVMSLSKSKILTILGHGRTMLVANKEWSGFHYGVWARDPALWQIEWTASQSSRYKETMCNIGKNVLTNVCSYKKLVSHTWKPQKEKIYTSHICRCCCWLHSITPGALWKEV